MKLYGYNKHFYMSPEGDPGVGSGGSGDSAEGNSPPPPPPPPSMGDDEPMISKREADKQRAEQRRKHERSMKEIQKRMEAQEAELEKLKKQQAAPPAPPTGARTVGATEEDTTAGKLEIMEQRFNRQIEELQKQVADAQGTAQEEREKRLSLERAQLIDKALADAGVAPKLLVQARRFFDPQVVWDKLEERWMFETTTGNMVEIAEGVAFELPDNLKSTKMKGGSGTSSGMPAKRKAQHAALEAAKKRMSEAKAEMKAAGGAKNHLLAKFTRAKNEVSRLEKELTVHN